jgi:predicted glycosyltransferase
MVTGSSPRDVVWIDLDNTPHIPFFAPIIQELQSRGYVVKLTVRDAYQACELAEFFKLKYERIGRHYGRYRVLKVAGTCFRALQLIWAIRNSAPRLAVAHSSRSQILAAAFLGIPCLQITDYEHASSAGFAKPTWLMVPDVIPASKLNVKSVLTYPGIKEDVYVPRFVPDPSIRAWLKVAEEDLLVTVRPPANEAHYHNPASEVLLDAVIELLAGTPAAKAVLLPRNGRQEKMLRERWPELINTGKLIIPTEAIDGLNLIWHSDLVISGGGTMNREAAALRVPVYSIFRGAIGAVDRYLARDGRLVLIETPDEVRKKIVLKKRHFDAAAQLGNRTTLTSIVDQIVQLVELGKQHRNHVDDAAEVAVHGARN